MPECEYTLNCPFFNDQMANRPATADLIKNEYCRKKYTACARYIVRSKLGADKVPPDLFPGHTDRIAGILS